ncbi:hypothetical protein LR48_Vigan02g092800 [Vigna angularis]|uniref:Uncharacterized protein n=1 Tax=Phaseolus angularis TaxID=3914 RepID=A0A0L9TW11_PHAAN|nr:hypothetical protein LR48_Vigan02g092800 [Vigna angularis]
MEMHLRYISQRLNDEVNTEVNFKEEGQTNVTESDKILDEKKIEGDEEKIERKEKEELSEKNKDEEKEKEVYCGGEDAAQPVPPRRARKERGPAQSQTSADTHEAEPFQMRDMYMSLIGAQLQSIHRGQVATAEMIVGMYDTPPAQRWTMDEFHNVVAWPEEPVHGGGAGAAEASGGGCI